MRYFFLFLFLLASNFVNAADIVLSWTPPTERTDGSEITQIDGYTIYYSIDNVVQEPITVEATSNNYTLVNVAKGTYTFQVTSTADGIEAERSEPIFVTLTDKQPIKIELTVRVID